MYRPSLSYFLWCVCVCMCVHAGALGGQNQSPPALDARPVGLAEHYSLETVCLYCRLLQCGLLHKETADLPLGLTTQSAHRKNRISKLQSVSTYSCTGKPDCNNNDGLHEISTCSREDKPIVAQKVICYNYRNAHLGLT